MAKAVRAQEAALALVAERKALIDEWAQVEVARHEATRAYFEGLLVGFVAERNRADSTKTINLPGAVLRARRMLPKVGADVAAFVAWAAGTRRSDLLPTKVEPNTTAIKSAALDGREAPPPYGGRPRRQHHLQRRCRQAQGGQRLMAGLGWSQRQARASEAEAARLCDCGHPVGGHPVGGHREAARGEWDHRRRRARGRGPRPRLPALRPFLEVAGSMPSRITMGE